MKTDSHYCALGALQPHLEWIRQLDRPIEPRDACKLLFRTFRLSADPAHMAFLLNSTADASMDTDWTKDVAAIDAVYADQSTSTRWATRKISSRARVFW